MISNATIFSAFTVLFLVSIVLISYHYADAAMLTLLFGSIAIGAVFILTDVRAKALLKTPTEGQRVKTVLQSWRENATHDMCIR